MRPCGDAKMADKMSFIVHLSIMLVWVSVEIVESTDTRGDDLAFSVFHSLSGEENSAFKQRGSIYVKSLKSSSGTFTQKEPLSLEDIDKLKDLASRNGYYRIKLQIKSTSSEDTSDSGVTTFVKACSLFTSRLTETITISIDNTGHLYGVGLMVPDSECQERTFSPDVATLPIYFNTSVVIFPQSAGQLPDTQTYIQRLEKEKRDQAAGKTQDNRSFLAKYWMYIVPVVIFMMLSSQQPEQQGEASS